MKQFLPHFIRQQFEEGNRHGYMTAYTLFVDLSGFTRLTEELMREGKPGAERLSVFLNEIFEPLVALVYARNGFIPYFAGDAFTAIFPQKNQEETGDALLHTALMARQLFEGRSRQFGGQFTVSIKTGLSVGEVEWGIVGAGPHAFYFRGPAIDRCAYCQTLAGEGDIMVDEVLRMQLSLRPSALEEVSWGVFKLLGQWPKIDIPEQAVPLPALPRELGRVFLPDAVIDYTGEGEFRTVISVFISFEGLDTYELLNRFTTIILDQVLVFSGYLKEIDFGDKGGLVTCFFGAPVSFENNLSRALEFSLILREEFKSLQAKNAYHYRMGMTIGTAFTGIVGGQERSQYAIVGNRVNLAARLMSYADWGDILVDEEVGRSKAFRFVHKGDIQYKGIKGNVPTFSLLGHNFDEKATFGNSPLIGRDEELAQLLDFVRQLTGNKTGGLIYLYGEAGIGKSRLAFEARQLLTKEQGINWRTCPSDQILRKPFNSFIYLLKEFFAQSQERNAPTNQVTFESRFHALRDQLGIMTDVRALGLLVELNRTKPILAALMGVTHEGSLWEQLDAKGRYDNTMWAIINLILADSLCRPVIIELEDIHWLDDSSQELVIELLRMMQGYPILLLATSRYKDDGSKPHFVSDKNTLPVLELDLNALTLSGVKSFAEHSLGGPISNEYLDLLVRTTNNNPFYLEQVLEYFKESQLLVMDNGQWTIRDKNIKLSNSINAILTARIDRLSTMVRETVKAAAVIGREFELTILSEVMREQMEVGAESAAQTTQLVQEQIKTGEQVQIWMAINELRYIFRHSLLREAVYSMQLHTRLQQLHQLIAKAIERLFPDQIEDRYVDLAFHYEQAGIYEKTCEYLRKAADYARANYQNQQALEFYDRLLQKLGSRVNAEEEISTQLKRGKILQLIGQWTDARQAFELALKRAKQHRDVMLIGKSNNSLGHLLLLRGDYDAALQYLQTAAGLFESIDYHRGFAKVYGDLGTLYFRRGSYEQAKAYFEQSLSSGYIQYNTSAGAQIIANLGLTYMNQGHFDEGIRVIVEQLNRISQQGEKQSMSILYTNLGIIQFEKGDYDAALQTYEKGLQFSEELGNKQLTAIAVGCIGNVHQRKGNYALALEHFQRDLILCEEIGDKQGIAIALGLLGELNSVMGKSAEAISFLHQAMSLCESLGYQKGIARAANTLGDVHYFLGDYEQSIHWYDRAIEVTRAIDNRQLLCASLIEKGQVLGAMQRTAELERVCLEAGRLASGLGNRELIFDARLLGALLLFYQGHPQSAAVEINALIYQDELSSGQQAAIAYARHIMAPKDEELRKQAVEHYVRMYTQMPHIVYKTRLRQLGYEE